MIDCKRYADEILDSITGYGHLAVISVGEDPASMAYIRGKKRDCERVGIGFSHYPFPDDTNMESVLYTIKLLNDNSDITGIIVQLPLPAHLDAEAICNSVAIEKDVDGFRPDSPFLPCTPEGVVHILRCELGNLTGRHAVIIGRGQLVGKPLQQMLLAENMTVSICHSKSYKCDIYALASNADAVIVAVGKPRALGFGFLRDDCVVIDCGVNRDENGKLCGDVGYCNSERRTPVPGGVGLMTRAMLMKHVGRC
ncbi:MAG: bifunctional 5,10-methylenetetrahydrofolate dehydrogenase/5,10-methenyltetrahydrofolate cyclohydrolase [Bacteroidaceae bacterium]|nr:bifunctional 5,10-methylenetetrahydrofolate dehydrogenase/5,10-methenyltetrahydrofolate cyclohydrolase [Bacteroidaceae bacterium]